MRYLLIVVLLSFGQGCSPTCRGVYTETVGGQLRKFDEHKVDGISGCVKDNVDFSHWDETLQAREQKAVTCTPQPQFGSRSLVSYNNFYSYRDNKVYLDLNSATGEYRKLTLAEDKNGKPVFSRLLGCWYEKAGQLLLDSTDVASSQYLDPSEAFSYTSTGATLEMVRFDDSIDWDYRFCPYLDTPWGFCDLLRNGNEMFYSALTVVQQNSLLNDALLIRKQFNYSRIVSQTFEDLWKDPSNGRTEAVREDYKYAVQTIVDTPRYIDQAWFDFIRGTRPTMPDLSSSRMPELCYNGKRTVTLSDGSSSTIYGQICYVDGQYSFTQ